ncbi:response regulator transcription factor [Adlercreutzia equolifaciens]|uniref:response regulator transcription factor n=1 Tax=Adlercreutzia equolifaciens TaxID=446660 RepID=UPI0023B1D955|nr:response regulator transcription factor [Adlercreutzia equolifaciens]MDE8701514.1 response regulator transcription factor [Adlercreutzia equolifaciens]
MVLDKPIKVMLIDDDPGIHESLRDLVEEEGYEFCGALSGKEGLRLLDQERPDLLLLDVMMPGMNGFDVCRQMRDEGRRIPVIFLTAKNDIVDKSTGFKAGADDYVTKPFIADELLLRIDAHVRRHRDDMQHARVHEADAAAEAVARVRPDHVVVGDLEVLFDRYEVRLRGEVVPLTAKEFEILSLLAERPGEVFTRRRIYEHLWGEVAEVDENSITVFMRKIREKIEDNPSEPRYLLTVWRVGYKLADE